MNAAELGSDKQQNGSTLTFMKGGRTRCEKGLILFIILLIAAVIGLIVAVVLINDKEERVTITDKEPEVCVTSGCARAAAQVFDSVDVAMDPCDDFYMHACGKWKKTHIIPETDSEVSIPSIIDERVAVINKYLLEDTKNFKSIEAVQKAKDLYISCINLTKIEELAEGPAINVLNNIGGWPILGEKPGGNWNESNFDLVDLLVKLRQFSYSPIVLSYVDVDARESTKHIIYIDQPYIGLPSRNYYLDPVLANMREAYANFVKSVAVIFGADPTTAQTDVEDTMALEIDLAKITMKAEDRRDHDAMYNKMTIGDLVNNFTESAPGDSIQFKWLRYFEKLLGSNGVNISINETEPIVIKAVPYFEKLVSTLQKYPRRTIANYITWYFFVERLNQLGEIFNGPLQEFLKVVYGISESSQRWRSCSNYVTSRMGFALGHMFVKETFDEDSKTAVLEMTSNVRDAFDELLEEADWMDNATRIVAKEKADAIREGIGYPDYILDINKLNERYENLTVNKDSYFDNELTSLNLGFKDSFRRLRKDVNKEEIWTLPPHVVNAYYSADTNAIVFLAGILQAPYYDKEQPKAMNYGGIGTFIGHEITHGFDDGGRQFDKNGNLRQWWKTEVITRFKEKAQCLIDQYSEFVVPEVGLNVNGITTQGENIADNGGVKQSFRAYRKWVARQGKEEKRLPGLNYTPDQLFFISYAQQWCTNVQPQSMIYRINNIPHSPRRFRVNGALQNSRDFQRVFNCPSSSYMNRAEKCGVW